MDTKIIIRIVKIVLWIGGLYAAALYSFHSIYFIVSGFYFMFTNLGKRRQGSLSAYSVFNQNFERLHGTMDGMQMLRGGLQKQNTKLVFEKGVPSSEGVVGLEKEQYFRNESKYGNKSCFCGSSIKFKKCCLVTERKKQEEERTKRIKGE